MTRKIRPCLWFNHNAEEAANFYADTFPDTRIDSISYAPDDYPSGKKGDVLVVNATICGMQVMMLNGGPEFKFDEAVSFMIETDSQEETDKYWNAIVLGGGEESYCGWCKDRFGFSWQITPRILNDYMEAGGPKAEKAFRAMMDMRKIIVADIERAVAE